MITITSSLANALENNSLVPRDFMTVSARNRSDNSTVKEHLWSGVEDIQVNVLNPFTNSTEARTFVGAGHMVGIGPVPRVGNLTVNTVTIQLSQVASDTDRLIRTYDPKYSVVELFRGWFDPDSKSLVDVARPRFVGFIDEIEVTTPKENEQGVVEVTCKSFTQELTRASAATRSDSYQRLRDANDTFRKYCATVGNREFRWGQS